MILRDERIIRITQNVHELIEPFRDRQVITNGTTTVHRNLRHPSLLDQLREAGAGAPKDDGSKRPVPQSAPPPGVEALERLDLIAGDVRLWLGVLGLMERETLEDNLRALVGAATTACDEDLRDLDRDTTAYTRAARVFIGWQVDTSFTPWRATCYICGSKGTLRIRLDLSTGVCLGCESTWGPENIQVLAEHVAASGQPVEAETVGSEWQAETA